MGLVYKVRKETIRWITKKQNVTKTNPRNKTLIFPAVGDKTCLTVVRAQVGVAIAAPRWANV